MGYSVLAQIKIFLNNQFLLYLDLREAGNMVSNNKERRKKEVFFYYIQHSIIIVLSNIGLPFHIVCLPPQFQLYIYVVRSYNDALFIPKLIYTGDCQDHLICSSVV